MSEIKEHQIKFSKVKIFLFLLLLVFVGIPLTLLLVLSVVTDLRHGFVNDVVDYEKINKLVIGLFCY